MNRHCRAYRNDVFLQSCAFSARRRSQSDMPNLSLSAYPSSRMRSGEAYPTFDRACEFEFRASGSVPG
jgi:hypothetical protein